MIMKKEVIHEKMTKQLDVRIENVQRALKIQKESLKTASESTAGDKHNTSRAMMHIEEEKLNRQLDQLFVLKKLSDKINLQKKDTHITLGSLIQTNYGWLYISIPFGNLVINEQEVMIVSLVSPIGKALQNKKTGDCIEFNSKKWKILKVY